MTAPDSRAGPGNRWQDEIIEREIPSGVSVLDLGCGDGELLAHLMAVKGIRAQGVEFDPEAVVRCIAHRVPVFQANLDEGLKGFPDDSFEYVVLEETLQTLHRPATILKEMLRVGRHGVVSFPNFGYRKVRIDLAERGRMPVTKWLPYQWYDTPNIHLFTLQDFQDWASEDGIRVLRGYALEDGAVRGLRSDDNLHAEEVLLVTKGR